MQDKINKIQSLIGFAIKSNSVIWGVDNLLLTKKPVRLVIMCYSNSEKNKIKLQTLAESKKITLIEFKTITLNELTHKRNVKVISLVNKELTKAILSENYNECYEIIKRGKF